MEKPTANDYPILEPLRQRWSPLAFAPTPVARETLRSLFEAARWAPSSFNEQPWRFLVGCRDGDPEAHAKLVTCLFEGNAVWAKEAPVLALGVAKKTFTHNGRENRVAAYDVGQAVGHLSVQASALGLFLHQMGGFSAEKARELFAIPEDFEPMAALALGYLGDSSRLADEALRRKHDDPVRTRRALAQTVFGSAWGAPSVMVER